MDVDNLLTDAGRAWREQHEPLVPRPDITGVIGGSSAESRVRRLPRVVVVGLAAVASTAIIASALVINDRVDRGGVLVASPASSLTPTLQGSTSGGPPTTGAATTGDTSTLESPPATVSPGADFAGVIAASTPVDPATIAAPYLQGQVEFQTPSGRIGCAVTDGSLSGKPSVECYIRDQTYPLPSKPADCEYGIDYGNYFGVSSSGAGQVLCLRDSITSNLDYKTMQYGQRVEYAGFVCVVSEDGVRCAVADLSHGFRVSRSSYELF